MSKLHGIHFVILTGCCHFHRSNLEKSRKRHLWKLAGRTVLEKLLNDFSMLGVDRVTVCVGADGIDVNELQIPQSLEVSFISEELPLGSAGILKAAAEKDFEADRFFVLNGSICRLPDLASVTSDHLRKKSDITAVIEAAHKRPNAIIGRTEGYVCERKVLDHIKPDTYFDMKEHLIPVLIRQGLSVGYVQLNKSVLHFIDSRSYLAAASRLLLEDGAESVIDTDDFHSQSQDDWVEASAQLHEDVKIFGPCVIEAKACIAKGCVIVGPTLIGKNARIERNTLIKNSIVWDDVHIQENCQISQCVVGDSTFVAKGGIHKSKVLAESTISKSRSLREMSSTKRISFNRAARNAFNTKTHSKVRMLIPGLVAMFLVLAYIWTYWPQFSDLLLKWRNSDLHSAGAIVPPLGMFLIWKKRSHLFENGINPGLLGVGIIIVAEMLRHMGSYFMYGSLERLSVIVALTGIYYLLFGFSSFIRALPIFVFSGLMLPLPAIVRNTVSVPLQELAIDSVVFAMETFGIAVVREGSYLNFDTISLLVSEGCNGLRMIMAFVILTSFAAFIISSPIWIKAAILASCIPLSLVCNSIRLCATAGFSIYLGSTGIQKIIHDIGGIAMMPLALGFVILELRVFSRLTKQSSITMSAVPASSKEDTHERD